MIQFKDLKSSGQSKDLNLTQMCCKEDGCKVTYSYWASRFFQEGLRCVCFSAPANSLPRLTTTAAMTTEGVTEMAPTSIKSTTGKFLYNPEPEDGTGS